MKTNFLIVSLIAVSAILNSACGDSKTIKSAKIVTEADSVSYLLGHSWGSNLKEHFPDIDPAVVAKGIQEAFEGTENALFADPMAIDGFIRAYMNKAQEKVASENLQKGVAFLEENAKREGVQTTESGLQYEVLVQGDGEKPTESSVVRVHYHGTTIDGVVFDSSLEKDPIEFPLNGVIKGWTEGLQLMNVGSKYKLYLPADLAYGNRQASAEIAANSALIFEVELLGIVEQTAE